MLDAFGFSEQDTSPPLGHTTGEKIPTSSEVSAWLGRGIPATYHPLIENIRCVLERDVCATDLAMLMDPACPSDVRELLTSSAQDKTFIDLGCGSPWMAKEFCRHFHLGSLVGIDLVLPSTISLRCMEVGPSAFAETAESPPCLYIESDMLAATSRINHQGGYVFHIHGIQPVHDLDDATRLGYFTALWKEVAGRMEQGDLALIGQSRFSDQIEWRQLLSKGCKQLTECRKDMRGYVILGKTGN